MVTLGDAGDFHFVLADADGFDEDVVAAGGGHQAGEIGGGAGESAHGAAGGHGADEDAGVGVVLLHAYAVAEDGASGEAAGGVDGEDGDRFVLGSQGQGQGVDEGALAGSGGSRDADDEGVAGGRAFSVARACGSRFSILVARRASSRGVMRGLPGGCKSVFHAKGRGSGASAQGFSLRLCKPLRAGLPFPQAWALVEPEFVGMRHVQDFRSWRAITRRWISLVPSPMVQSLTSR